MPNKKRPLSAGAFLKKFAAYSIDTACLSAFGVLQNFQMILQAKADYRLYCLENDPVQNNKNRNRDQQFGGS